MADWSQDWRSCVNLRGYSVDCYGKHTGGKMVVSREDLDQYLDDFLRKYISESCGITDITQINLPTAIRKVCAKQLEGLVAGVANSLLSELKEIRAPSGSHPDYVAGKADAIMKTLGVIDKQFGTDYASKAKIERVIV
jgi:hypothetical protein